MPNVLVKGKGGTLTLPEGGKLGLFMIPEPEWHADHDANVCQECGKHFSFMMRRHHCRASGLVLCGDCCPSRLPILRMGYLDPVRVSRKKEEEVQSGNELMGKHIKFLRTPHKFDVRASTGLEGEFEVSLSFDHTVLFFKKGKAKEPSLSIDVRTLIGVVKRDVGSTKGAELLTSDGRRAVVHGEKNDVKSLRRALTACVAALHPDEVHEKHAPAEADAPAADAPASST